MDIVKYDISEAAISQMKNVYMDLVITNIANQEEFDAVHDARMIVKGKRIQVEKKRAELKADSLNWGRKVDAEAKRIKGLLEPIEIHLSTQEKKVTDEQKRKKAEAEALEKELINKRVSALFAVGVNMPFFDVAMLEPVEYKKLLSEATEKYQAEQKRITDKDAAQKAKAERLEAEAERLKKIQEEQEAETRKKLAEQKAVLEKIRLKQEKAAQAIADKEKALEQEREAIEAEKQKELERENRVAFEKVALAEAKIKAEKDAIAKAEREAREKKEREAAEVAEKVRQEAEKKRQAEIAPDREKLLDLVMTIRQIISPPAIKNETAKEIVKTILVALSVIADNLEEQSEEL